MNWSHPFILPVVGACGDQSHALDDLHAAGDAAKDRVLACSHDRAA